MAFPGIFPDLTRYQAEADQASVNAGHDPWKNDPVQVAKALEARFFGWQRAVTAKLLSGGGPQDVSATVQVQEASVQGSTPTSWSRSAAWRAIPTTCGSPPAWLTGRA